MIDLTEKANDWRAFNFPDGQPHVEIFDVATGDNLLCRISSPEDLLRVLLVADIAKRNYPLKRQHLTISYLMGARMDRPMLSDGSWHPFTLRVVTDLLKTVDWASIELFDPHSDVAAALLNASVRLPYNHVESAVARSGRPDMLLIAPDAGAIKRVESIAAHLQLPMTYGLKHRDTATGKLSGFKLVDPSVVKNRPCLIVDDILDGGRTFSGIGQELLAAGAMCVDLYVSHGIFSAGFDIPNIRHVYTTDSYQAFDSTPENVTVFPWRM